MKAHIQIVSVVQHAGRSKKTGNDFDMRMAQCVVRKSDSAGSKSSVLIGVLSLPDRFKDLGKGDYEVDFDIAVQMNSRIGAEVFNILPWSSSSLSSSGAKTMVEILDVVPMSGFSKKTMRDYDMRLAQCLVHKLDRETGEVHDLVGELLLPERYKDIKVGSYEVAFELSIGRDKRIGSQVSTMELVDVSKRAAPAPVDSKNHTLTPK